MNPMDDLGDALRDLADDQGFSGSIRVDRGRARLVEFASGFANRAEDVPNQLGTRFGVASVTKGLTALTVRSLIDEGRLAAEATVRSILGELLPNVDPAVTVEHLVTHTSGVGDHLDEEQLDDIDDYVMGDHPVHTFGRSADYARLLAPLAQVSVPGERFAYNNGGFVILGMLVEALTGSFHEAVVERVLRPAGMADSGFFRSDDLPPRTALGYLQDGRTNVLHLPVIGAGDGGIYLAADDCHHLWGALRSGRVVAPASFTAMTTVTTRAAEDGAAYGRGFWLSPDADHVWLEGMDAGVSAQTGWIRSADVTYAVLSNTSSGAWPLAKAIVAAATKPARTGPG